MNELKKKIFVSELDHLRHCEGIIAKGKATFLEVGNALLAIRSNKLWKNAEPPQGESDYANFEDYCQRKHQFGKSYASRLIGALEVESVTIGNKMNEAQARELRKVPEDKREAVVERTREKSGDKALTAKGIRETAEEATEEEPDIEPEATPEDYEEIGAAPVADWLTDAAEELAIACGNKLMVAEFLDGLAEFVTNSGEAVAVARLENLSIRLRKGL